MTSIQAEGLVLAQKHAQLQGISQPDASNPGGEAGAGIPQDRQGRFRTEVFERYQRSEKTLVGALPEMYIQGVSTRKVKRSRRSLCGHEVSAATVSRLNQKLDEDLERFAKRQLLEVYPYLILDARYGKVRQDGVISQAAPIASVWIGRGGGICWQSS
ncbi:MAG: transposase [Acidobacteriia bacterium]|nr:transposase [Terriglobia bacterium]